MHGLLANILYACCYSSGRLVLADALYYASSVYKPKVIIDVATLTGAMMIALGDVYAGAFVTS